MQIKSVLLAALVGLTAIEASAIPSESNGLVARQRGGGRGGGRNRGNNNQGNNNNQNNGGNNNNQDDDAAAADDAADNGNNDNDNDNNNNDNNNNGGNNNGADAATCLAADAIQDGSASDGQNGDAADGQVASATDDANFINFCSGKTLTNGLQIQGGSCNGIPMGEIPASNRMVSTMLLNPVHNDNIEENQDFEVQVKIDNLQAGFFTNPQETYYSAPQALNGNGQVIGHTHVVIQDLGDSLNPGNALDASQFVFFKGINDNGDGQGTLSATVDGGLPAGNYRVCTMSGASNHQPVLMPVAQRGTQEDCNKFTVGGNNNNGGNDNNNDNNDGGNNNNNNNNNSGSDNNGNNQNNNNNDNNQNNGNNDNADNNNDNNGGNDNQNNNNGGGGNGGASAANALGGIAAPEVTDSGNDNRPFSVNGNTFVNEGAAIQRACAIQNNACSDAANSGQLNGVSVGDCGAQEAACVAELS